MKDYKTGICAHCGAELGLHKFDNSECPKNGVEETREGKRQEWQETTFEDSGEKKLKDAAPELLEALTNHEMTMGLMEWEILPKNSNGYIAWAKIQEAINKATT